MDVQPDSRRQTEESCLEGQPTLSIGQPSPPNLSKTFKFLWMNFSHVLGHMVLPVA
jgi:hypothetical protein